MIAGFRSIGTFLGSPEFFWGLLWGGVGVFAVDLLLLMETRWGQRRLLQKCLILSLLFHLLVIGYCTTLPIVTMLEAAPVVAISFADSADPGVPEGGKEPAGEAKSSASAPWEGFAVKESVWPVTVAPQRAAAAMPPVQRSEKAARVALPSVGESLAAVPSAARAPERVGKGSSIASVIPTPTPVESRGAARQAEPAVPQPGQFQLARLTEPAPAEAAQGTKSSRATAPHALLAGGPSLTRMSVSAEPVETPSTVAAPDGNTSPAKPLVGVPLASTGEGGQGGTGATGGGGGTTLGRMWSASAPRSGGKVAGETGGLVSVSEALPPPAAALLAGNPGRPAEIYKLRTAADRQQIAQRHGATAQTEAAVRNALKWLAGVQEADGRWSAAAQEGGRELKIKGHDRRSAGSRADHGMTGLALLSLLGCGHTHRDGLYQEQVRRGLEFLISTQRADGNLAGEGNIYDAMYCHAIAGFALSEAWGMTGDAALAEPVQRAVGYTLRAQHRTQGGWRYQPGDLGDTSQLGWQFMVLRSGELAGLALPDAARQGAINYLDAVAQGQHGGLAGYRPGELPTRTMTAEALFCWQVLGLSREHAAAREAADFVCTELPRPETMNLYYWYYGTLAMYQMQGDYWQRWNEALRSALVQSQRTGGKLGGSWDPDPVWGTYGGRIYSTALAAMCLEVYYRFLPLYKDAGR